MKEEMEKRYPYHIRDVHISDLYPGGSGEQKVLYLCAVCRSNQVS